MLEDLEVILKSLHYVNNHGPQIENIMILVITINSADFADKNLVATSAHLGQWKSMQRAQFRRCCYSWLFRSVASTDQL